MNQSKDYSDLLLYFVPAFLVLVAMFMVIKRSLDTYLITMRKFLDRDIQLKSMDDRATRQKEGIPLKLQAYERLVLFLERINPNSILVRVHLNKPGMK